MKLAILIACSEYSNNKVANLPACKNDLKTIHDLLSASNEFEHIFQSLNESSHVLSDKLIDFITEHTNSNNEIDQVFFYFSGHGYRDNEDFYFCLEQTDVNKLKSTTISNITLDGYLKQLNPKVAIKVVDACFSGETYIKNIDDSFLNRNKQTFHDVYFMFSSRSTETSLATNEYSAFTKLFFDAILNQKDINRITYKSIIDYLSDMSNKLDHTPFFVTQGTHTAFMFDNLKSVQKFLQEKTKISIQYPDSTIQNENSLLDKIRIQAQKYCSKEEGLNKIDSIFNTLSEYQLQDIELQKIFQSEVEVFDSVPFGTKKIGVWITDQKNKQDFLVREVTHEEEHRIELDHYEQVIESLRRPTFYSTPKTHKTIIKQVISGINFLENTNQKAAILKFLPKPEFANMQEYASCFTIVFSKSELFIFYNFEKLAMENWSNSKPPKCDDWKFEKFSLKEFKDSYLVDILKKIEQLLINDLVKSFNSVEINQMGTPSVQHKK